MRNRILSLIALTAAALIPVSGAGVRPAQALTDPMYGAPTVGQCYNISGATVISSPTATAPTVPCSGQHTVLITEVVQIPATMTLSGAAFDAYVTRHCLPSRVAASGGSRFRYGRSSYTGFAFIPTMEQQDQGAHWVSCLMGIIQGSTILRITGAYPHLPANPAAKLKLCLRSDYYLTNCAAPHKWHPVSAKTITSSVANIRNRAYSVCRAYFGSGVQNWAYAWKMVQPMSTWVVSCMRS